MSAFAGRTTRTAVAIGGAALAVAGTALVTLAGAASASPTAQLATRAPACTAGQLAVSRGSSQGGMQHAGFPIVYRNTSSRACELVGYPGVAAVNRHGAVVVDAKRTTSGYLAGAPDRALRLKPGHDASAFVEWVDMTDHGRECKAVAGIDTTAPNTTKTVHREWQVSRCRLEVHPVTYGRTGSHPIRSPRGAARAAWIHGAKVSSAETNRYLARAAKDLASSTTHDYSTQVGRLHRLAALPETGLTRHQRHEAHRLVAALDAFFHTPKLYR